MARGTAALALGAGAGILVALAAIWALTGGEPDPRQAQESPQVLPTGPTDPVETGAVAADVTVEPAADPVVPGLEVPRFDLVRVDAGGLATLAGSAPPGAQVSLRLDGVEIGQAKADAAGQFAILLTLEPSQAPRLLGLVLMLPEGGELAGPDLVALAPVLTSPVSPPPVSPSPVEVAATAEAASAPEPQPEPQPEAGSEPEPEPEATAAPAALLLAPEGVTVLQDSGAVAARPALPISIDSIAYGASGEVLLGGRARPGADLRVYLDEVSVAEVRTDAQGNWRASLAGVAEGLHVLRADEIGADGAVVSRFETPFKREVPQALPDTALASSASAEPAASLGAPGAAEAPAPIALAPGMQNAERLSLAPPAPDPAPVTAAAPITITVQPGLTLWAIARENFGAGMMYVQVFEANRDKIKDPDLIYPGQVFTVPKP